MVKKLSKIRVLERKTSDFRLKTRCTEHSSMVTICVSKRAFRIGVIWANRILVAKVMAKILQRTWKLPKLGQIMISCQFCADLPAPGNSAPSMHNLTAQHRLTRIPLHQMGLIILKFGPECFSGIYWNFILYKMRWKTQKVQKWYIM